ncbi:hypothetical protein K458DRAFT_392533 [Lentithecium fluviatile CBS 122367]|uniref:Uncharacterized protein n=1 Tax=Lentithecium fluviatile CBS 122367 TaxID=1168545 RepID=A0A6G1IRI7_9PLEO|nr:hypothetical protein K458DRAFT_392533 [Lentithecium fluviatile CBS 122367]
MNTSPVGLVSNLSVEESGFGTINYHDVFYGNWRYDTGFKTVTIDTEEYGEAVQYVSSPGPQAAFRDDFDATAKPAASPTRSTLFSRRSSLALQYASRLVPLLGSTGVENEDLKERKIMRLLLKVKNGTPPMRKTALRLTTSCANTELRKSRLYAVAYNQTSHIDRTWRSQRQESAPSPDQFHLQASSTAHERVNMTVREPGMVVDAISIFLLIECTRED